MIANHWSKKFASLYGGRWPETYLCVDTEYTGGSEEKDVIYEIGHVLVEDRRVVDSLNVVLDWTNHPVVPAHWVQHALRRAELKRAERGQKMRVTWDVMKEEGLKPEDVLKFYWELFRRIKGRNLLFVAHHGYFADERMLKANFEGFLGKRFRFGENGLFDTGAIEKASQCLDSDDPSIRKRRHIWLPQPADTLEAYFRRVVNSPAKGIFWSLERCAAKYDLHTRFSLDPNGHHSAGFDALVCHYLMEEFRSRVTVDHGPEENPFKDPATLQRAFDIEIAKSREARAKEDLPYKPENEEDAPGERAKAQMAPRTPFAPRRRIRGQRPL